jgi:hypothetical protein
MLYAEISLELHNQKHWRGMLDSVAALARLFTTNHLGSCAIRLQDKGAGGGGGGAAHLSNK